MFLKKAITVLCFSCIYVTAYSFGLADWSYTTKHGSSLSYPGNWNTLKLKNGEHLDELSRWYFYNNHIMGEFFMPKRVLSKQQQKHYFIANELEYTIQTFDNVILWEAAIQSQNLKPKIWTRWYRSHTSLMFIITLWAIVAFPITIALLFGFIYFLYKTWKKERFNPKGNCTKFLIITTSFIGLTLWWNTIITSF